MNLSVKIADTFGEFCANGEKAAQFRFEQIDPYVSSCFEIEIDFYGVRNMNSSFCNALVANLISQCPDVLPKLKFVNCRANIRSLIEVAVELGVSRIEGREPAL